MKRKAQYAGDKREAETGKQPPAARSADRNYSAFLP